MEALADTKRNGRIKKFKTSLAKRKRKTRYEIVMLRPEPHTKLRVCFKLQS